MNVTSERWNVPAHLGPHLGWEGGLQITRKAAAVMVAVRGDGRAPQQKLYFWYLEWRDVDERRGRNGHAFQSFSAPSTQK